MKFILIFAFSIFSSEMMRAQTTDWNTPGAGNPIIPGYFADPTIRKFGDTYYIYATTDGTGNGYGPPQVWASKDFLNWKNVTMNWPTTEVVWAPDVVQQPDGSFRYYYCTPCEVRVGESNSPIGPWQNRLGRSDAVLVPDRFVHNAITLDPQLFVDDDGSEYLYFGTWGIYKGFGCGVAKLAEDGKSFVDKKLIENTEITDFFEAPFVFKKDGIYYFTYSSGSCHDDTYRVQYAISKDGPMGPYEYKGCILKTNADGTVHGPGHHSILVDGDHYYIVYHRHNLPRSIHGFNRQVCIDEMHFDKDGNILPIEPTHNGLLPHSLIGKTKTSKNLAYQAKVSASSEYSEWFKASYAVDDNNATLWRARSCNDAAWLMIDLGSEMAFNEILTQFEYATFFYQYKIETSNDGRTWRMYADKTKNVYQGSPMIDTGNVKARYIRITITDTQKNGHFPAIWNVKVYNATQTDDPLRLLPDIKPDEKSLVEGYPWIHKKDVESNERPPSAWYHNRIVDINAADYTPGKLYYEIKNKGVAGSFSSTEGVAVVPKEGKLAFRFDGKSHLTSSFNLPRTMIYNAPYTICAWVLNPEVSEMECVAQFMPVGNDLATIEFRNGKSRNEGIIAHNASFENIGASNAVKEGVWQYWSVVYDGYMETIYCDGAKVKEQNSFLMLRPEGPVTIGSSSFGGNPFSGYLHNLEFYDRPLDEEEIKENFIKYSDISDEILKEMDELSPLADKKFDLILQPVSPTSSIVKFVEKGGAELEKGLYDFAFGVSPDLMAKTSTNEMVVSHNKTNNKIYGKVYDLFGNSSEMVVKKLKTSYKPFKDLAASLSVPFNSGGELKLSSEKTNLDADATNPVPMSLVDVNGNFVIQCRVVDLTGMSRHNTPAYNEGGLIVVNRNGERQNLIHLGVFPNYNCGNMLTVVRGRMRPQYKNNKGWNFDPYMQLERRGNQIYARTSSDGIVWTEMPQSPVDCSFMDNGTLQIGLYQTTYSDNSAYVTFDDIKIWEKK